MAEGGDQTEEKTLCDLCDTNMDAELFKCLDCDLFMCHKCYQAHRRVPVTRRHTVISGVLRRGNTKEVLRMCSVHSTDEISHYCCSCDDLICQKCIHDDHKQHECMKLKDFADRKRHEIENRIEDVKETEIQAIQANLKMIEDMVKLNDKSKQETKRRMYERKLQILAEIDNINNEIAAENDNIHQDNNDKLSAAEAQIPDMEAFYKEYDEILNTGSDIEVIMAEEEFSKQLAKLDASEVENIDTEINLSSFVPGETDTGVFQTFFGSLQINSTSGLAQNV